MRLHIRRIAVLLALLLASGCGYGPVENISMPHFMQNNEIAPVSMTNYTKSDFKVFVKEEITTSSELEPDNGCYIGSYVLANSHIGYDMKRFDYAVRKKHALSVYHMRLGEEFPYEWVLECVADMKTPYIVVKPANGYDIFREDLLVSTASGFGNISSPIFVDFYPNPQSYTNNAQKYAEFYRMASKAFSEYAPNTIMVISADTKSVYDFDIFYPGDEYVEWVGITLYQPLYSNGEVNLRNYMKDLDYFYTMYQRRKPLIVSQLAFSSFSTVDHRYASQEGSKRLSDFYEKLRTEYTRIKAVNYMDFNNIDGAPKKAERDNFSVTQDEKMLEAYSNAIKDEHYLSTTTSVGSKTKIENIRKYYPVYEDENYKFVSASVFEPGALGGKELQRVIINGTTYYSTEELSRYWSVQINELNKQIIIGSK